MEIPRHYVSSVQFYVMGDDDIKRASVLHVLTPDLMQSGAPRDDGLNSMHLGSTDYRTLCKTCHNDKKHCLGHTGDAPLRYYVLQPLFIDELLRWLKLICFNCGLPIIDVANELVGIPTSRLLNEGAKRARALEVKECIHCKAVHPFVDKDSGNPMSVVIRASKKKATRYTDLMGELPTRDIYRIVNRITNDTVTRLGRPLSSHPRNFVLKSIIVTPKSARPDAQFFGVGRVSNDDITTRLQLVLGCDHSLPKEIPEGKIPDNIAKQYKMLNMAYYEYVKGGRGSPASKSGDMRMQQRPLKSLGGELITKQGLIRQAILGKRAWKSARSIIAGNQNMRLDEIGIPLALARSIYIMEVVREWNYEFLNMCYLNGVTKYPGCDFIIKHETGERYISTIVNGTYKLQIGDRVSRNIKSGDYLNFNRQPSLTNTNTSGMKAVVLRDADTLAFEFNVLSRNAFNADFDGDEMQVHIHDSPRVIAEIKHLSYISNWLISAQNGSTTYAQHQDSLVGSFLMTRSSVRMNKMNAMRMFNKSIYKPSFREGAAPPQTPAGNKDEPRTKQIFTGREVMSKILPQSLNYKSKASIYNPDYASLHYDPDEINVKIVNGQIKSGVLDKASIGPSSKSIYILIKNLVGPSKCLEIMYSMQQIVIEFMLAHGFTMGLNDVVVDDAALTYVQDVVNRLFYESQQLTKKLDAGEIVPPIGQTVEEHYEALQINTLKDAFPQVMRSFDFDNGMFAMILSGSNKGTWDNLLRMCCIYGQAKNADDGTRMREMFSHSRTLPFFPQFDTSPEARGFVTDSYLGGLNPAAYMFLAMLARYDLTKVALGTAVGGTLERQGMKSFEPNIVDYYRGVKNDNAITQMVYGDCGCDPRFMQWSTIQTIKMTDAELKALYEPPPEYRGGSAESDELVIASCEKYYKIAKDDRDLYRDTFIGMEHYNRNKLISDTIMSPVNVAQLLEGALTSEEGKPKDGRLPEKIKVVMLMCERLAYCGDVSAIEGFSEKPSKTNAAPHLSPFAKTSTLQLKILIRATLVPSKLAQLRMDRLILLTHEIELAYINALVDAGHAVGTLAAQLMSEPITQSSLNTKWGMAKASGVSGADAIKELLNGRVRSRLQMPRMLLHMRAEHDTPEMAREVANKIEMLKMNLFVISYEIFIEQYGHPTHPKYKDDIKQIEAFHKYNPLMVPPTDLTKWCARIVLDQFQMVHKNITIQTIAYALTHSFPECYVIYYGEETPTPIIRIYFRAMAITRTLTTSSASDVIIIENKLQVILDEKIRGVRDIEAVNVIDNYVKSYVDPTDGSIKQKKSREIVTSGINVFDVFANYRELDPALAVLDSLWDNIYYYGVNASRQKMICDLRFHAGGDVAYHHAVTYVDQLLYLGYPTSVEKAGLEKREYTKVFHRMASTFPLPTISSACLYNLKERVTTVSSALMVGRPPKIGSVYSDLIVDEDFVKANRKSVTSAIADL